MQRYQSIILSVCVWFSVVGLPVHASVTGQAAIAMPDTYSAKVAKQVLLAGGNAFDAAIAAGFVLAVTYPEAGNIGGGGFMTLHVADAQPKQRFTFLDYREKAPKAAHRELYLDKNRQVIPYKSLIGYQASGVPGTVMGFWQLHQRYGSRPWSELLQPSIFLAEHGFRVPEGLEKTAQWYQQWVANKSSQALNFDTYFGALKNGTIFIQPELAATLSRIAEKGARDFYFGKTAELLVDEMADNDGLITHEDLQSYEAKWRQPIVASWSGRQIISAPPPSSGGIAIVQWLKMKEQLNEKFDQALQWHVAEGSDVAVLESHFYAELSKRVYADRAVYLGDSDFVRVPKAELIAEPYLAKRANEVSISSISHTEKVKHGVIESPETTHFSIMDGAGNAVSNTYTLNMPFGSGVVITGAGFLMNNEMDDFSTKPGVANIFGVVGGKANEIAPEKRMLSSMSPTILMKDGKVEMVVGTPGGSTIITSVAQTIVNVIEKGMSAQAAVDAPRVHHQLLPKDVITYNPDLPADVLSELESMGYTMKYNPYMGDVQLIVSQDGHLSAASDRRGRGVAEVFATAP